MYPYSNADGSFFVPYSGAYNEADYPYRTLDAAFTSDEIRVDGRADGAWETAPGSPIAQAGPSAFGSADTSGTLRALGNVPMLYLLIVVRNSSV
ncbi:MAG: hypothetical protein ILP09_05390, partial [Oscillospiraceae bacterium]|nr:hypothetical protein [Oscillospiraceae bacterium]